MINFFIILFLCITSYSTAFAKPAITCHCFKDRSFDAENPGKVDEYLLATTQNSFLASVSDISKKEIVGSKMTGTHEDELSIACFVASRTRFNFDTLISERKKHNGSWKTTLTHLKIGVAQLDSLFTTALTNGEPDPTLAAIATDQLVTEHLGTKKDIIKKLREQGASTKEIILSSFFSVLSGRPAYEFYKSVKSGRISWGSHMNSLGIEANKTEAAMKKILPHSEH